MSFLTRPNIKHYLIFFIIVIIVLIFYLGRTSISNFIDKLYKYELMVVVSGSMEPVFNTGDVILVSTGKKGTDYKKGDVITFWDPSGIERLITHRVLEIYKMGGQVWYKTKGDANAVADFLPVQDSNIVGQFRMRVPYFGNFLQFCKAHQWLLWLIILIGLLIIRNRQS